GRVRTEWVDKTPFDVGFQVLLDQYPEVINQLNLKALNLKRFEPGAIIHLQTQTYRLNDLSRSLNGFWSTICAPVGTLKDKLKLYSLSQRLKLKSTEAIFSGPNIDTLSYLKNIGFSDKIINCFFKPFLSGIFLEVELKTSARMFEFVFKMFAQGYAAIPNRGIQAVALQLQEHLEGIEWNFNHAVHPENLPEADVLLYTYQPDNDKSSWNDVDVLYFSCLYTPDEKPILHLVADEGSLINNFHYLKPLFEQADDVLSVTVVEHRGLSKSELALQVEQELLSLCNISTRKLLRHFRIPKALPMIDRPTYAPSSKDLKVSDRIYRCGDGLANASLNAAMLSGKMAAEAIIKDY
ncbi:MAG: FAD-dependent oxidoreductase, partial [Flavobacteriaceae bacterium]|nr:FAD-dependent oxidoreductase [Flavobacteriaceae bacterium]